MRPSAMRSRITATFAVTAIALSLSACEGGDDDASGGDGGAPTATAAGAPTTTANSEPVTTTAPDTVDTAGTTVAAGPVDGDALAVALADEMMTDGGAVSTEAEAQCWAGRVVDDIGADRLAELGMTVDNVGDIQDLAFTPDETSLLVESLFDCVDVKTSFAKQFEANFGPEGAACIAEQLDEDLVKLAITSSIEGATEPPPEFLDAFGTIMETCGLSAG